MTEKRFTIEKSSIVEDGFFICDNTGKFSFPTTKDKSDLIMYVKHLNKLNNENEQLKQELQKIQDDFELNWTQNRVEFNKDKLYIKDTNTEICLDDRNLSIRVRIPSLNEYYLFKYIVTGRSLMREFVEKYSSKGDVE